MELKHHTTLDPEKWQGYTLGRQIIMIANETNRAIHWLVHDDTAEANRCLERAIELLHLTIGLPHGRGRHRELARLEEVLLGFRYLAKATVRELRMAQEALIAMSPESWRMLHASSQGGTP
jgi:hypothetical protein